MESMMERISSASAGMTAVRQASGNDRSAGLSSGDFETFLKMLTVQIKNQDPLNPMEGTEFAVQLATFSGVEQQILTNQLLSQLALSSSGELDQYAGWIGREVRTPAPVLFDQSPLTLDVQASAGADDMILIAYDARGNVVSRESIGSRDGEIDWLGRDVAGNSLPSGKYHFRVESLRDGEVINVSHAEAYSRVTGVEVVGNKPRLVLSGGASAEIDEITAIRE